MIPRRFAPGIVRLANLTALSLVRLESHKKKAESKFGLLVNLLN